MKNRYLFVLLVLLVSEYVLYSQSKIACYFELSPNYSYRSYHELESGADTTLFESEDIVYKSFSMRYASAESPGMGFGFSTGLEYSINSNLDLRFGAGYKRLILKITETFPIERYPFGASYPPPESESSSEIFYHAFHYLGLPVDIQYSPWKSNTLKIGFLLGLDTDLYIGRNYRDKKVSSLEDSKYQYAGISKLCLSFRGGMKINLKLSESISLSLRPEFVRYISPNVKYDIQIPSPLTESYTYSRINQYYYFGQFTVGLSISE